MQRFFKTFKIKCNIKSLWWRWSLLVWGDVCGYCIFMQINLQFATSEGYSLHVWVWKEGAEGGGDGVIMRCKRSRWYTWCVLTAHWYCSFHQHMVHFTIEIYRLFQEKKEKAYFQWAIIVLYKLSLYFFSGFLHWRSLQTSLALLALSSSQQCRPPLGWLRPALYLLRNQYRAHRCNSKHKVRLVTRVLTHIIKLMMLKCWNLGCMISSNYLLLEHYSFSGIRGSCKVRRLSESWGVIHPIGRYYVMLDVVFFTE